MVRAELERLHPRPKGRAMTRARREPQPGYLQTEVKAFQAARSEGKGVRKPRQITDNAAPQFKVVR